MYPESVTHDPPKKLQASPLYSQLARRFEHNIRTKLWSVGEVLPSEGNLARQFGVSVGTARKALEVLEREGWILRRQGRGTFVADPAKRQKRQLIKILLRNGVEDVHSGCSIKVLESGLLCPSRDEISTLNIQPGGSVFRARRLFNSGASPVMVEEICLVPDVLGDADENIVMQSDIVDFVLRYGGKCRESISTLMAPTDVAADLGLSENVHSLLCRRIVDGPNGQPLGLANCWIRPAAAYCSVTLVN